MNSYLSKQSAFIFDLDGCIYSGNTVYPAAKELLRILRLSGKQVLFLSNNSRHAAETIRGKIATMGLPVEDMPILVATELVGQYLFDKYGIMRLQTVGSVELEECLKRSGHQVISFGFPQECDALVFGLDTAFSYEKLYECSRQLSLGGKLVATNLDFYHPGEGGHRIPETGALIEAVKAVAGIREVELIGKPSLYPFEQAVKRTGLSPEACVMIGDNPYTDIRGARSIGMVTIWISHGGEFPGDMGFRPDITVNSLEKLLELFC